MCTPFKRKPEHNRHIFQRMELGAFVPFPGGLRRAQRFAKHLTEVTAYPRGFATTTKRSFRAELVNGEAIIRRIT